jgi:3'-phosphoadenosine 5'-phosphosulfate sulfotransferase (PAPS reductase)/FAD synthetase
MYDYVVFASGGNDSVALVVWAKNAGLKNVVVSYSNTGWASPDWPERIEQFSAFVKSCGFDFAEIQSEGFDNLVRRKKGFPANKPKFCTYELKIKPAKEWLDIVDPEKNAVCMVGVRREESTARLNWPEYVDESENHGGRDLWSPLVRVKEVERNELIKESGLEVLPHRSRECSPCVNSNRGDFRMLPQADIDKVRELEKEIFRPMFRVKKFQGAEGIDQVMQWAWSERGKYRKEDFECDSGMCGG